MAGAVALKNIGLKKKSEATRTAHDDSHSAHSRLKAQLSAVLRDQLMSELKGMQSAEEAAIWARRILPAKNALNSADGRQIEEAFQAKLADVEGATGEPDEHALAVRPAPNAQPAEGSIHKWPASIDKCHLPYPEPRRIRDRDHVRFVAKQPCLICDRKPADPHHLSFAQPRALGRKVSDEFTVPLCRGHHREVHRSGNEAAWWTNAGVDPTVSARALWLETHPLPTSADKMASESTSSTTTVGAD
jgi:hypothetical protein